MPKTSFDDQYRHSNVFEMAAGCLFHLVRNQPFLNGNKGTARMCALVFLGSNGQQLRADPDELYRLVDGFPAGRVGKAEVSVFFKRHCAGR